MVTVDKAAPAPAETGTVIATYRKHTVVEDVAGQQFNCQQLKTAGQVVCGDSVQWRKENDLTGVITQINPRKSLLQRPDKNGKQRIIASNIDTMFIVLASQPAFNEGLLDRYLVAAENSHLQACLVLNKTDLLSESEQRDIEQRLLPYTRIGYSLLHTSTKRLHGLDELRQHLLNKKSIFVGQSGVGKSSLINSLIESANARIGDISDATGKGKHTTTTAYLYHLKQAEGYIIDSPGVREFGLLELSAEQVTQGFREFAEFIGHCKFRNCMHRNEPGCAILQAVEDGKISPRRLESYYRILESSNTK